MLTDSPVDYYEMETATGTDSGSGGRTLTKTGITTGVAGKVGNAWSFNGTSDSASTGSWMGTLTAFTFEAWIKAPSASGMTGDYHTIIRRDGTDIVLLRVRGSNITGNVNPGQLEAYIAGTTLVSGASYRVDDGNWHHVAVTVNGTSATLYVDGVSRATATTSKSSYTLGTAAGYIGSANGTSEYFKGTMDEVAVYTTALTGTRISAHYAAATSTTIDLSTVTVNAAANDVTVESNAKTVTLTATADKNDQGNGTATSVSIDNNFGRSGAVNFDMSALAGGTVVSATLSLYVTRSGSGTVFAERATSAWSEASGFPSSTITNRGSTSVAGGAGFVNVNVGAALQDIVNAGAYNGFLVFSTANGAALSTRESANVPSLTVIYVPAPVDIQTDTLTASAAVYTPTVEYAYTVDASTVTASAQSYDVTVEGTADTSVSTVTVSASVDTVTVETVTSPDAIVDVDTDTASATAYDVTVSGGTLTDADTVTASAQVEAVTVEVTSNALIDVDSPKVTYTHIQVADINGEPVLPTEDEDPYFESTMYNNPTGWYRFNDVTQPPVPRVYGNVAEADLVNYAGSFSGGVVIGLNTGPNGRKHVHFDGTGMFTAFEHTSVDFDPLGVNEAGSYNSTLEFSVRTTKADQFIMRIDDRRRTQGDTSSSFEAPRDLYLVNGKLQLRRVVQGSTSAYNDKVQRVEWTAYTNLADGEWHHIVLTSQSDFYGDVFTNARMNVYVDGDFELRRTGWPMSMPDYIGGRPGGGGYYFPLPQSEWFVGDVSEVVIYNERTLDEDRIHVQYDNIFGYQPFYADTAKATVKTDEVTVKSNTKRVLVIDMRAPSAIDGNPSYVIDGHIFAFSGLVARGASMTNGVRRGKYQIFSTRATVAPQGGNYYDERTSEPRLLDLEVDVNLADFDIVNIINYPSDSDDFDFYEAMFGRPALYGGLSGHQQIEKIVSDVRQFAIDGGGVFVSDPAVAVALGVIGDIDFVPHLQEPRDPAVDIGGSYSNWQDLRSAQINPWGANKGELNTPNVAVDGPIAITPDVVRDANFYYDLHSNRKQRVVTLVEGLTDLPGDILVDALAWSGYRATGAHEAEKYEHRHNGLNLGDEFWIMGTPMAGRSTWWDDEAYGGGMPPIDARDSGYPAAPLSAIKAGVPVTTFAEQVWTGADSVPNPYRDYAVSIAVRPGDVLNGSVMAGRIFVSFTEGFVEAAPDMMHSIWDVIPPNSELRLEWQESDYAREWSWSTWRGAWSSTGGSQSSNGSTVTQNGDQIIITPEPQDVLSGLRYTSRYDQRYEDAPTIHYRGLNWLGADLDSDGTATVGVATVTATAAVTAATVEVQNTTEVAVGSLEVVVTAYEDADAQSTDAVVLVTTPTAVAKVEPFAEQIDLSTLTVTARAYDDADGIQLSSDWVVLRLPSHTAYITLEDK